MDIFQSPFYRFNARLLKSVAQWPSDDGRKRRMHQIVFHIIIFTVVMSQGIKLIEIWGNLDIMIECITPMSVQLCSMCKTINCIINRKKMLRLVDAMKNDWSKLKKPDEIKILTSYAEQGQKLTQYYAGYLFGSLILYLLIPLMPRFLNIIMPRNESRPLTYLYQTQYYVDPEEYFYPILVHTYVGTIITVTAVVAADSMYATYVQHVCGIFAIVGNRLEQLGQGSDLDFDVNPLKNDDECYWKLVNCIDQHFQAIEFACLIESSHSTAYLLQVGAGVVMLSISGVQILIKFGQYEEMIRITQFTLAQLSHLLFNSWPGQKLIDQCDDLRNSVYCSKWYSLSLRTRKLLTIMMLRSSTPQKITAGKLYDMSMENYGVVVKTSVSYFTVFSSFR